MITWNDLRREPYRLLFPLGLLSGGLGVGHWFAYALGWLPTGSGFFHASVQLNAYMMGFILGFLMTALPRFAAAKPASSAELSAVLGLFLGQLIASAASWWPIAHGCQAALLIFLAVFAGRRFARRTASVRPPTEFVWIPIGLFLGVVGSLLLGLGQGGVISPRWLALARPLAQQGFLLAVVLGVAGFMAPRLMGHATLIVSPQGISAEQAHAIRRRRIQWHIAAAAGFAASFGLEGLGWLRAAYLCRAVVITAQLSWTTAWYRRPVVRDTYVRLLWISLWMVVLGAWGAGLWPAYRVAMLHLMFLGGFSLMTFAVGTMVIFSHAGQGPKLQQPLWILRIVAVGIGMAVIARVVADGQPQAYFFWLALGSGAWLVAAVSWLLAVTPLLLRVPVPGTFERMHEATKQQVLKTVSL